MIKADFISKGNAKLSESLKQKIKGIYEMNSLKLEVGIFDTAKYPNGTSVAMVGYWNEYGTANIPPRPFFRLAVDNNNHKWISIYKQQIQTTNDIKRSLSKVGVIASNDIKKSLTALREPPNAISTIKAKGSSNPLIDTGTLRNSINWSVVNKWMF